MIKHLFTILFFLIAVAVSSQTIYSVEKGDVTFYSYAPLEDIKAESKQVNGLINTLTGEIAFIIPMRSFHFPKSLMEEHFNEKYIESEKFPQASYKGKINEKIDFSATGVFQLTTSGILSLHGKEKEINEKGTIEISKEKITLTTEFNVAISDFNIKIPQLLFNNVADTVQVKLKANYVPYKKK